VQALHEAGAALLASSDAEVLPPGAAWGHGCCGGGGGGGGQGGQGGWPAAAAVTGLRCW
jgi:hypothetical protein